MEVILLILGLAIQIVLISLAAKYRGIMWALFGSFVGLGVILSMVESGAEISYISNGVVVTISSGGFFFMIPLMLLIVSLLQVIQLK